MKSIIRKILLEKDVNRKDILNAYKFINGHDGFGLPYEDKKRKI